LVWFAAGNPWMTLWRKIAPLGIIAVFAATFPARVRAQSPGPREYLNIPVDQAVAYVDYVGSSAETLAADLPVPNNVSVSQVIATTVLVSFPIDNKYAGASLTWPYSKLEITGPGGKIETWGFNDPAIAFHKNIFGLRALRHDEMGQYIPKTLLSFHLTVNLPLGSYDRNSPVNAGSNRWAFTPLVNLNVPLNSGWAGNAHLSKPHLSTVFPQRSFSKIFTNSR
jgi:hypothetical protein